MVANPCKNFIVIGLAMLKLYVFEFLSFRLENFIYGLKILVVGV